MNILELMQQNIRYNVNHMDMPTELQNKAKTLCWEYNQTRPDASSERSIILKELLGTYHPLVFIEPSFKCNYGFNIHMKGLTIINYNCVILDTSPFILGKMFLLHRSMYCLCWASDNL